MYELLNKATTHTWVEERQAYAILEDATNTLRSIFAHMKLFSIRNRIYSAQMRAKAIIDGIRKPDGQQKREFCS